MSMCHGGKSQAVGYGARISWNHCAPGVASAAISGIRIPSGFFITKCFKGIKLDKNMEELGM